ncbi:MAG: hypothetical protein COA50_11365 [Flavobacteriaceae bacterium]|nr:MAG: hypothetical protein COA50_11365 [Flavobacteriaceae bacterium]
MKSNSIKLIAITTLVVLSAFSYWYLSRDAYMNIFEKETEIYTNAEKLISSFVSNQDLANVTFVEKIVEVQGIVKEVSYLNDRCTIFLEAGKHETKNSIICDMQTNQLHSIHNLKSGDSVLIKGLFKGFLMDGIMLNCALLKKNINE